MIKIIFALTVLLISELAMCSEKCESEWKLLQKNSLGKSTDELLLNWERKQPMCDGSWFFEYKKAALLITLQRYAQAKLISKEAKDKYKDASPFEFNLITLEKINAAESGGISESFLLEMEKKLLALDGRVISNYPEYKSEVAAVKLSNDDVDGAIKFALSGLESGESWSLLRTLALAYEAKGNYAAAKSVLDRLAVNSPEIFKSRKELLLLAARIYAANGRMDLTKQAVAQAADKADKGLEDPEIKATIDFIRGKISSGEFAVKQN